MIYNKPKLHEMDQNKSALGTCSEGSGAGPSSSCTTGSDDGDRYCYGGSGDIRCSSGTAAYFGGDRCNSGTSADTTCGTGNSPLY
jgi:hypothetical protein